MILSFLNINKRMNKLIIIILLNSIFLLANEIVEDNDIAYIEFDGDNYYVYFIRYDGTKDFIIEYPRWPSYKVNNDIVELNLGCGSPCWSTMFYNRSNGDVSNNFEVVIATDYDRQLTVVSEYDEKLGFDGVVVYSIFKPECKMRVHLPLAKDIVAVNYYLECELNYPICSVKYPKYYDEKADCPHDTLETFTINSKDVCIEEYKDAE